MYNRRYLSVMVRVLLLLVIVTAAATSIAATPTLLAQTQQPSAAAYTFALEVKLTGEFSPSPPPRDLAVELRENNVVKVRQSEPQSATTDNNPTPTRTYRLLWQTNVQDLELVFVSPSSSAAATTTATPIAGSSSNEDILLRYPLDAKGVAAGSYSIGLEFKSVKKDAQGQGQEAQYIIEWAGKPATVTRGLPDWVTAGSGSGTSTGTTTTTISSSTVSATSTNSSSSITTTTQNNRDGQGQGQTGNSVAGRQITFVGWVIILVSLAIGLAFCYNALQVWRLPAKLKARLASRSNSRSRPRPRKPATTTVTTTDDASNDDEPTATTGKDDAHNTAKPKRKPTQPQPQPQSQQPPKSKPGKSKQQPQPQDEEQEEDITPPVPVLSLEDGVGVGADASEVETRASFVQRREREGEGEGRLSTLAATATAPTPTPGKMVSDAADGSVSDEELEYLWSDVDDEDEDDGEGGDLTFDNAPYFASSYSSSASASTSDDAGEDGDDNHDEEEDEDNKKPPSPPSAPVPPRRKVLQFFPFADDNKAPNSSGGGGGGGGNAVIMGARGGRGTTTTTNTSTKSAPAKGMTLLPEKLTRPGQGKTKGMGLSESSFEVEACALIERYGAEWLGVGRVRVSKQVSLMGLLRRMGETPSKLSKLFTDSEQRYVERTSLDMVTEVMLNAQSQVVDYFVVVETDGTYFHSSLKQKRKDAIKNEWVSRCGFALVRVTDTKQLEAEFRRVGRDHAGKIRQASTSSQGARLVSKALSRADKYQPQTQD
jgi:hypothetical protein